MVSYSLLLWAGEDSLSSMYLIHSCCTDIFLHFFYFLFLNSDLAQQEFHDPIREDFCAVVVKARRLNKLGNVHSTQGYGLDLFMREWQRLNPVGYKLLTNSG